MKATLDFLLNGARVTLDAERPTRTLLTWLRETRGLAGTKEGRAEGDCGACTVVLADLDAGKLRYQPVNSCILCIGALEGKEVITVEGLKKGAALHPVQQAMVDCHGSQCGFCTPASSWRSTRATKAARPWISGMPSPATSAAAPATGRSSTPASARRARRGPTEQAEDQARANALPGCRRRRRASAAFSP